MTNINIALTGGDANTKIASGLFKGVGDPPPDPNLIAENEGKLRSWTKDLASVAGGTDYTFQIDAEGTAGTQLTVTVKKADGTGDPKTFQYTLVGDPPGVVVEYVKNFVFNVGADGGVS